MTIRPARPEDAPAVAALLGGHPAEVRALIGLIARGKVRGLLLVAEADGAIVGAGRCGWRAHPGGERPAGWYLQGVAVAPDAQRRGVGRALVEARLRWMAGQGAAEVWSQAAGSAAARALHVRCGFRAVRGDLMRYEVDPSVLCVGACSLCCA